MSRNRAWAAKLLLLLVSLLFACFLSETVTRLYIRFTRHTLHEEDYRQRAPNGSDFVLLDVIRLSDNPDLIYELIPGREGSLYGAPYRSNSQGMRDAEVLPEKPSGVWRIAALGDSSMFGWRVPADQCYVEFLEWALNLAGDPVRYEVLNFAVPGYNTAMEGEQFISRAKGFDPDLTLIQFDVNDIALPNFLETQPSLLTIRRSYLLGLGRQIFVDRGAQEALAQIAAPRLEQIPVPLYQ
ncbi:SGNH/GDSL hydrolase family protein, partial [bacterium]|nr:SGNH/GDSL hydrolase family protein [bacterium]